MWLFSLTAEPIIRILMGELAPFLERATPKSPVLSFSALLHFCLVDPLLESSEPSLALSPPISFRESVLHRHSNGIKR
jgi:hypothetical protein